MRAWIFLISMHFVVSLKGLPKKLNLGLIIDTSTAIDSNSLDIAKIFSEQLLQHYSISQGTTRVSLVTLAKKVHQVFSFEKHVNREYVLASLRRISCCDGGRISRKSLDKALQYMEVGRNERPSEMFLFVGKLSLKRIRKHIQNIEELVAKKYIRFQIFVLGKVENEESTAICKSTRIGCHSLTSIGDIKSLMQVIGVPRANFTQCSGNGKLFDECERHCDCINGSLQNCYRLRKEFTQMTKQERQRYLQVYMKLTTEQPYKNRYERFVYLHYKYFCYGIHRKDLFCPWHRFYILQMENLLREIDCRVTLPYWDWSYVGVDPWNGTDLWSDSDDGIGGNGDASQGFCVQSGLFSQGKWYTPFFNDPLDIIASTMDLFEDDPVSEEDILPDLSDCLRRYFYGSLPDEEYVRRSLEIPADEFEDFDINLRLNYHDKTHNAIGGTMCTHYAATAPEFFLHHSFLDKIWFMWQQKSPAHHNAHFANSTTNLVGFTHIAKELVDSHNLPGHVKVTYSKFPERKMEKRGVVGDAEYVDDNNKQPYSVYRGILETASEGAFPSCKRSKREKARANYLFDLFSKDDT